jgi:hypothetical protein
MTARDVVSTSFVGLPGVPPSTLPEVLGRPQLDAFAKRAGPDVAYRSQETYAVFRMDPQTHATQVAIFDGDGRLLRLIPPSSVAQMVAAMTSYRRR